MISSLSVSIPDRGLGLARTRDLPIAIVGCCSGGDIASPTLVTGPDAVVDEFGYGPAVALCAKLLEEAGGPLLLCRTTTATAGQLGAYHQRGEGSAASGSLSADGGNSSTAIPALSGTPSGAMGGSHAVLIEVVTAGANIAANPAVRISLDGGLTWYADDATNVSASATAIGTTGLSLAWTDGSFVDGDTWTAYGANCPTDGDATGTSVLTLSGTPVDAFEVRVSVTRAATTAGDGTGAVRYSLDGGLTYLPEQPVPTSRQVVLGDTGVTVTFSAASLVEGDEYYFKTTAPVFNAAGLLAALQALEEAGVTDHEAVFIAGAIDASYFSTITGSYARLLASSRVRWFFGHARDQASARTEESESAYTAALVGSTPGFSGQNHNMVVIAGGASRVLDTTQGNPKVRRSILFGLASRIAQIDAAEHPGRVRSGALPIESLIHDLASSGLRVLDTNGFIGAQSVQGLTGSYATDATRAAPGSDFVTIMRVRVACFAARAALSRLTEELNESVPLNPDGTIRADVADGLDANVTSYMTRELGRRVSSVSVQVDRTANLAETPTLPFRVRMVPIGYSSAISLDLGFTLARSN